MSEAIKRKTMRKILEETGFTFGFFRLSTFKKYPELIPITLVTAAACSWCVFSMTYFMVTKPDVRLVRSRGLPHHDISPTMCTKYYCGGGESYRPIAELEATRNDLK